MRATPTAATRPSKTVPGRLGVLFLVFVFTATVLGSALRAEFLNFDDDRFFGPRSELAAAGLAGVFDPTRTIAEAYLPVSHAWFWLENQVFAGPLGPHLLALGLQFLFVVLVARLAVELGLSRRRAVVVAALVAAHPALVESVVWASGQKDLLAGNFVVATLLVLVRHARGEMSTGRAAATAALFTVLAMYAKGTAAVVAPFAAGVAFLAPGRWGTARWGTGRWGTGRWLPALCVVAIAAVASLHHSALAAAAGTMSGGGGLTGRIAQVPGAALHYVTTALWPGNLDGLYPEVKTIEAFRNALVPGSIVVAAWLTAIVALRRRLPLVAGGLAAFAIALLPFNTAWPATSIAAADRYLHLAIPGLAVAFVALPRAGLVAGMIALVPLVLIARDRAAAFESSENLWTASLQRDSENAAALGNLAAARAARGDAEAGAGLREVEDLLERAVDVARYPQHRWRAAASLADLAERDGRLPRALEYAVRAAQAADEVDPRQPGAFETRLRAHLVAARAARRNDDFAAATRHYEVARELAPEHPFVLAFAASLLHAEAMQKDGTVDPKDPRVAAADRLLDAAERADPSLYEVHWTRGVWRRATGRSLEAEASFRKAIEVDPRRSEAWLARCDLFLAEAGLAATAERIAREGAAVVGEANAAPLLFRRALALGALGQLDDARTLYEACHQLRPNDVQIQAGLAAVLAAIGVRDLYTTSPDVLARLAERIETLDPTNPQGQLVRAVALRGKKQIADALILLEQVRSAMPDDKEVRQLLVETLRDLGWQLWLDESTRVQSWPYFLRFAREAPTGFDTEAVRNLLDTEWQRRLRAGQDALLANDARGAERVLRGCFELFPDRSEPNLQLGMALLLRDPESATLEEALRCFELAADGQRRATRDPGLAVLYQVTALRRLGRFDDAKQRGDVYLAAPRDGTDESVAERIKALLDR